MRSLLLICGPTACHKSETALRIGGRWGGEILSIDSVAVYRGMDIGSAKPDPSERRRVPHHLIDIVEPDDRSFSVAAFQKAADLDLPISLHEEDPQFIKQPGVNMGKVSEQLGYGGASSEAEYSMVKRDCELAVQTGAALCIQHISAKESVEYVRQAKQKGADVHAEATPHHFTLTEDAVLKYGTYARMNPPLRTEEDRQAIIEGIVDGTIDMIVTDHAPHSKEEKDRPMDKAPSGITGLETSLGLGIKSLVQPGHISLVKLMELMSTNPAKLYRMIPGSISEDEPADIVIFGENEEWEVKEEEYASKAVNSPFTGWTLPGKVHYTICGGKIVYWGV